VKASDCYAADRQNEQRTRHLANAKLRANPSYRLVPYDDLDPQTQEACKQELEDPDFFGLLLSESAHAPVRSMSRDAALLFRTFEQPSVRPQLLRSIFGSEIELEVRRLLLDGIFQVEIDGVFRSGPEELPESLPMGKVPIATISKLSMDAIAYASKLDTVTHQQLTGRLYAFNRLPSTPRFQRRFRTPENILSYIMTGSEAIRRAANQWTHQIGNNGWVSWERGEPTKALPYKLFISPCPDALKDIFMPTLIAIAQAGCTRFKIGGNANNLLRSDKFVAYFAALEDLHRAAETLRTLSTEVAAQGVPFTAVIDMEGLLSWGMDPPTSAGTGSWRQWIVERVATYIEQAREAELTDPFPYVARRVALDGIDPICWKPSLTIWLGQSAQAKDA
jgi:hypothetical protein